MEEKAFEGALLYKVIRKPHEENSKKTRPKSHAGGQGQWQKWLTMHLGRRIEEVIQKQSYMFYVDIYNFWSYIER